MVYRPAGPVASKILPICNMYLLILVQGHGGEACPFHSRSVMSKNTLQLIFSFSINYFLMRNVSELKI